LGSGTIDVHDSAGELSGDLREKITFVLGGWSVSNFKVVPDAGRTLAHCIGIQTSDWGRMLLASKCRRGVVRWLMLNENQSRTHGGEKEQLTIQLRTQFAVRCGAVL